MKYAILAVALAVSLSGCATAQTTRSVEQRTADRETLGLILQYCEVTITGNTEAAVNASVLPSASAGLRIAIGGNCKPVAPHSEAPPSEPVG